MGIIHALMFCVIVLPDLASPLPLSIVTGEPSLDLSAVSNISSLFFNATIWDDLTNLSNITSIADLDRRATWAFLINGPVFKYFPTANHQNAAVQGYIDMFMMSISALKHIGSPSFYRYFKPGDECTVAGILQNILGPQGWGLDVLWNFSVYYYRAYDEPMDPGACTMDFHGRTPLGYLEQRLPAKLGDPGGQRGYLVICPLAYSIAPVVLSHHTCQDIGLYARPKWCVLGCTMLHEMIHWQTKSGQWTPGGVSDWKMLQDPNSWPQDGYGPVNCMRLNQLPGPSQGVNNADSYVWFALESFWEEQCGVQGFQDPVWDNLFNAAPWPMPM